MGSVDPVNGYGYLIGSWRNPKDPNNKEKIFGYNLVL